MTKMTDTVNVSEEMIDAVMKVAVGVDECGSEVFPGPLVAAELVRAALDAAQKTEPVSDPCKFAAWVEEMTAKHGNPNGTDYEQGQNDMGVRIASRLRSIVVHPEAPKVEQEPWDYAVRYRDYGWGLASDLPADERELVLRGIPFWEVKPLYTHPAPASDELLEALAKSVSSVLTPRQMRALSERNGRGAFTKGTFDRLYNLGLMDMNFYPTDAGEAVLSYIANHKGPQS